MHVFHGTGHAAAILQPEQYAAVIRGFVEQAEATAAVEAGSGSSD